MRDTVSWITVDVVSVQSKAPTDLTAFSVSEIRPDAPGPPCITAPPCMVADADGAHVSSGTAQAVALLMLWRELRFAAAGNPATTSLAAVTTGQWRA